MPVLVQRRGVSLLSGLVVLNALTENVAKEISLSIKLCYHSIDQQLQQSSLGVMFHILGSLAHMCQNLSFYHRSFPGSSTT